MCTLPRLIRSCIPGFILPYQNIALLPSPFLHIVKWALAKTEIKEFKTIKWKFLSPHFTLLAPDLLPFHMPYYSVLKPPFEVGFEEDEGKGAEGKTDPFFPLVYDFLERQVRKVHGTLPDVLATPVISR